MNITGIGNNPSLAPVNPQAQARETGGTFGNRMVQIRKTVGRVLLGIVTLGGSELIRALRSYSARQKVTQPQDQRLTFN